MDLIRLEFTRLEVEGCVAKTKRDRATESVRLICRDCSTARHLGHAAVPHRKRGDINKVARELVSRVYEDVLHEACTIFVGSGCTTEGKGWHSETFYDDIKAKSHFPSKLPPPAFPDLMEYFCKRLDGGRHNRLIREALLRIERFSVPGDDNTFRNDVRGRVGRNSVLQSLRDDKLGPFLRAIVRDTDFDGRR